MKRIAILGIRRFSKIIVNLLLQHFEDFFRIISATFLSKYFIDKRQPMFTFDVAVAKHSSEITFVGQQKGTLLKTISFQNKTRIKQSTTTWSHGGGHVVSMLTFYADDQSSNPTEVHNFSVKLLLKRTKQKKRPGWPFLKTVNQPDSTNFVNGSITVQLVSSLIGQ